jgi:hypothetical protein
LCPEDRTSTRDWTQKQQNGENQTAITAAAAEAECSSTSSQGEYLKSSHFIVVECEWRPGVDGNDMRPDGVQNDFCRHLSL